MIDLNAVYSSAGLALSSLRRLRDRSFEEECLMAKILIVDDEPRIRELIRENLQYSGYTCEEAGIWLRRPVAAHRRRLRSGHPRFDDALHGRHDLPAGDAHPPHQHPRHHPDGPRRGVRQAGRPRGRRRRLCGQALLPRELVARVKAVLNRTMPRTEASDSTMTFGSCPSTRPATPSRSRARK